MKVFWKKMQVPDTKQDAMGYDNGIQGGQRKRCAGVLSGVPMCNSGDGV